MIASLTRAASLGGVLLDSLQPGNERVVTKLTGWGAAPQRVDDEDKAQQDGGWDSAGNSGSRVVALEGFIRCGSLAEAIAEGRALSAMTARTAVPLIIDEGAGALTALVRVTVGADPEWLSGTEFSYKVQVKAADPLLYGPETFASTTLAGSAGGTGLPYPLAFPLDYGVPPGVTPGAITLSNVGTAAYWPRLRIDGPVPNPSVTLVETGDTLRFNGTVAAGQWLDIDTANRRVLLNGQVSMRHLVSASGRWLSVPVGGGSLAWTADAADPAATLSAWGYEGAWL